MARSLLQSSLPLGEDQGPKGVSMEEIQGHLGSDVFYDFEEMSCGDLLIALLKAMRPLPAGTLVEVRALDPGAPIDIPAWCTPVVRRIHITSYGRESNTHGKAPD